MTNIINGKFPTAVLPVEQNNEELKHMAKVVLNYLGILKKESQLCRYGDDFTIKNNHQYILAWLEKYLKQYDGEEDAMKQLIPRFKEHLNFQESYFA